LYYNLRMRKKDYKRMESRLCALEVMLKEKSSTSKQTVELQKLKFVFAIFSLILISVISIGVFYFKYTSYNYQQELVVMKELNASLVELIKRQDLLLVANNNGAGTGLSSLQWTNWVTGMGLFFGSIVICIGLQSYLFIVAGASQLSVGVGTDVDKVDVGVDTTGLDQLLGPASTLSTTDSQFFNFMNEMNDLLKGAEKVCGPDPIPIPNLDEFLDPDMATRMIVNEKLQLLLDIISQSLS